jgi:hypothetical protein
VAFAPAEFPELRTDPEITATGARFSQTAGGRTGAPMPRPVTGKPFVQWTAPTVWTTLALSIGLDGSARGELTGASAFPRHWVYDPRGQLAAKAGLADFRQWMATAHGRHSPWGEEDSRPLVTVGESALERQLSAVIMAGGAKPATRKRAKGALLTEQGEPGADIYLLLDGILSVWVDGVEVGELGPGAVVGERALLEGGRRAATLRAVQKAADHERGNAAMTSRAIRPQRVRGVAGWDYAVLRSARSWLYLRWWRAAWDGWRGTRCGWKGAR